MRDRHVSDQLSLGGKPVGGPYVEDLLRPATQVTMTSSAIGTSDWRAEEASPARPARLDKQNDERLCTMCHERETCAESVRTRRNSAQTSM